MQCLVHRVCCCMSHDSHTVLPVAGAAAASADTAFLLSLDAQGEAILWSIPLQHCSRQLQAPQAQPDQLLAEHPTPLTPFASPQRTPLSCMALSPAHSLAAFAGQQGLLRLCFLNPAALRSEGAWMTAPQGTLPAQDVRCLAWCSSSYSSSPKGSDQALLAVGCGPQLVCTQWYALPAAAAIAAAALCTSSTDMCSLL